MKTSTTKKSDELEVLPACPVEVTLKMINSRWAVLILRDLLTGTKRNAELLHSLHGISQKVLTSTLRTMEKNGLVSRTVYAEVPPRVEYQLTPCGESLKPLLDSMVLWGNNYKASREAMLQREDAADTSTTTAAVPHEITPLASDSDELQKGSMLIKE